MTITKTSPRSCGNLVNAAPYLQCPVTEFRDFYEDRANVCAGATGAMLESAGAAYFHFEVELDLAVLAAEERYPGAGPTAGLAAFSHGETDRVITAWSRRAWRRADM